MNKTLEENSLKFLMVLPYLLNLHDLINSSTQLNHSLSFPGFQENSTSCLSGFKTAICSFIIYSSFALELERINLY